ncbi:MAG: TIGR03982 family His-Xaa-Ser system protein [Gammaproteobacteria bacterium]|nr:TIGR03982 family His-Xaa-Ser system protein [Gammaproteobacteria bacterium]
MRLKKALLLVLFLIVGKEVLLPAFVGAYYYYPYQEYVVACDTAMDDSWYYKDNTLDKSEQVQLLACHDYDKARKIMLMSGLPEEYLSYLGLKALDLYQRPAEEFVRLHRFRER